MCHYRHQAHDDPLRLAGLQDITAHVDFTAVAQAGVRSGLQLAGYTTQAHFLVNLGITDLLGRLPSNDPGYIRDAAAAQKLLSPAEMGELFKVIALSRGPLAPLSGFGRGDLSRLL
jgi:SAM-dependent MidA family methyltransferase